MSTVIKTTFDAEQKAKDEAFLKLSPIERMEQAFQLREMMKKKGLDYSFKGKKVKITRLP